MRFHRKHYDSAECLKAISIIGVVWIHSFNLNKSIVNTQVIADIFRFCVPSFIILWAFFYEHGLECRNYNKYSGYIGKRLFRLAIPYIFWSLLHLFIFYDVSEIGWSTLLNGHFGGYGWAGQFFLIILFQLTVLLPFIRKFVTWGSTWFVLVTCLTLYWWVAYGLWQIELIQKLGHRFFIYWVPYVFLGIVIAKEGVPQLSVPLIILFILTVIAVPLEFQSFRVQKISFSPYVIPSVLISSMALSIAVLSMKHIGPLPLFLRTIGNNTFAIFLLNPLVVRVVGPYLKDLLSPVYVPILSDISMTLLILVLCLFVAQVLRWFSLGVIIGQ